MADNLEDSVKLEATEVQNTESEVKPSEKSEKGGGKEAKVRKKDDKRAAEQYLRSLSDVPTVEDRLEALCKKYSEVFEENRKLQLTVKRYEKKMQIMQREKEQLQTDQSKAALTRRRLENLCRELQKQNKAMKDESQSAMREQEEMRKKLNDKFQGNFSQLQGYLHDFVGRNAKLHEDVMERKKWDDTMTEKLRGMQQQHEEILSMIPQLRAEQEKARLDLFTLDLEKEMLLIEKEELLTKITQHQTQIKEQQATELGLRSQISMYSDKYDEVQSALAKNNEVYEEFTEEMKQMSKKILTLEKESNLWKHQWEASQASLTEMKANRKQKDSEVAALNKKLSLLQDLCKQFQCERVGLIAQLKEEHGGCKTSTHKSKENAKNGKHAGRSSSKASDSAHKKSKREEAEKAGESGKNKQDRNTRSESKETVKSDCQNDEHQVEIGKSDESNKDTCDSSRSSEDTTPVKMEEHKAESKLEVLADETEAADAETKNVEFFTEQCSLPKPENAARESESDDSERDNKVDSKLGSSPPISTNVENVTAASRLVDESGQEQCKEDICTRQEQGEHVSDNKEQEESVCSSKEQVEHVCSAKEEVGNDSGSNEQEESVCTNKEQEESICPSKEEEVNEELGPNVKSVCNDAETSRTNETQTEEKVNVAAESLGANFSNDKPEQSNKSSAKSEGMETKSSKPASAKSGRRRKK